MKINFNNVRKQAVRNYARLVEVLNEATDEDGYIHISALEIEEIMDDLRTTLGAIACSYLKDDPDIRDLSNEIGDIPCFFDFDEEK